MKRASLRCGPKPQSLRGEAVIPTPRVSVVIPHLNEPDDLGRCLDRLDVQRNEAIPFEVIVVDNGSRVPPAEICAAFLDTRLEREARPGPGPARSHGAAVARGEFVVFIDADCLAEEGWLRAIVEYFDAHPDIHVIAGDVQVLRRDPAAPTVLELYENIFSYLIPLYVERDHYAATGNMAVRRDVFMKVGPFGGIGMAEDRDWGRRATAMGYKLAYLPEARVLTPACKDFAELAKRWDRAIAHDYAEDIAKPNGRIRWLARSMMVAGSPVFEIARILRSGKVRNMTEAWKAFTCLARIRFYRAGRMLTQATHGKASATLERWNRG